jgi:hypothetical protein
MNQSRPTRIANPATPPTTPPAIAPVLDDEFSGGLAVAVSVGEREDPVVLVVVVMPGVALDIVDGGVGVDVVAVDGGLKD